MIRLMFKRDKFSFYGELEALHRRLTAEFVHDSDSSRLVQEEIKNWIIYATVGKDRRKLNKRKYGEPRLAKIELDIREHISTVVPNVDKVQYHS